MKGDNRYNSWSVLQILSKMMPFGPPPTQAPKRPKGKYDFITSWYHDEFKWSSVKSVGLFVLGVGLARSLRGVDLFVPA